MKFPTTSNNEFGREDRSGAVRLFGRASLVLEQASMQRFRLS